jgi:hypothetical protein
LGDLDLRHKIRFECGSDTAYHRHHEGSVRKFYYSARIHGCNANLTAAVYQGETAEEVWLPYSFNFSLLTDSVQGFAGHRPEIFLASVRNCSKPCIVYIFATAIPMLFNCLAP